MCSIAEYFLKDDIESELVCEMCHSRYDEPKILPCGNLVCLKCEIQYFKVNDLKKCPICNDDHFLPLNGFPISKLIQKLLRKAPISVYRGEIHKNASKQTDEIGRICESFQCDAKNYTKLIQAHCNLLRENIEVKSESLMTLINSYKSDFYEKIALYEDKCTKSNKNLNEIIEFLNQCFEKHNKWVNFLNQSDLEDSQIEDVFKETLKMKKQIDLHKLKFDSIIFDEKKLFFHQNLVKLKQESIGILTQTELELYFFDSLMNDNPKKIKFNDQNYTLFGCYAWETETYKFCMVGMIDENNGTSKYTLKLKLFDKEGELIKEINENSIDPTFWAVKLNNIIVIAYQFRKIDP
jgi:hypothetical protein